MLECQIISCTKIQKIKYDPRHAGASDEDTTASPNPTHFDFSQVHLIYFGILHHIQLFNKLGIMKALKRRPHAHMRALVNVGCLHY